MASGVSRRPWLWLLPLIQLCFAGELALSSIDAKAFEQRAQAPGIFVVAFCMPWFEPCQALNQQLVIAADGLAKTADLNVYEFDCTEDANFCTSMEIISFPTIRIFDHHQWKRYRGALKASSIVSHLLKQVLDPVAELDEQRLNVMKALDLPLMVLTHSRKDDSSLDIINSLAKHELSTRFFVGVQTESPLQEAADAAQPSLMVFSIFDETIPTYRGSFERAAVLEFANKVSSPLIRLLDLPSLVDFVQSGLPLAILFSTNEKERNSLAKGLTSIAMKYRGQINFATVDAEKHSYLLQHFSLDAVHLPAFVVQTSDDVFVYQEKSQITADAMDVFIGKVIPHVHEL